MFVENKAGLLPALSVSEGGMLYKQIASLPARLLISARSFISCRSMTQKKPVNSNYNHQQTDRICTE